MNLEELLTSLVAGALGGGAFVFFVGKYLADKSLEYYKGEYQKSIKNFDLYRVKKHEVYGEINEILYGDKGFLLSGLNKYLIEKVDFYDTFTDEEIREKIISNIKGMLFSDQQIENLFILRQSNKKEFASQLKSWFNFGSNKELGDNWQTFRSYLLKNRLYISKNLITDLNGIESKIYELLILYTMKEDGLIEDHRNFYEQISITSKEIKSKMEEIIDSMKNEISNYNVK